MRRRKDGILEYTIGTQAAILELISVIKPYLILKRKQADLMEKIIKSKREVKNAKEFQRLMDLVNQFANLNYSKKRITHKLTP